VRGEKENGKKEMTRGEASCQMGPTPFENRAFLAMDPP